MTAGIERTSARRAAHGLYQHPVKPEVASRAELLNANFHSRVPLRRLGDVCSQQPVPPRQIETEVRICLAWIDRMVDPVHVRRDYDPSEDAVYRTR